MKNCLQNIVSDRRCALIFVAGFSAAALAIAYVSQYAYGLHPCELCLYQRAPYALVVLFGILGIAMSGKSPSAPRLFLGLSALAFAVNAVFASYHTGVERKWWPSFLEGCTIPSFEGSISDVLAQIEAAPLARCDEIPWTDPVIGLSMANYNVLFCALLAAFALWAAMRRA